MKNIKEEEAGEEITIRRRPKIGNRKRRGREMVKERASVAVSVRKVEFPRKRAKSRKKNFRGSERNLGMMR